MSDPHKHHFVPRFYQRGFIAAGSNQLWVYEKGKKPRKRSTRKTGMRIDLYAFSDSRGIKDSVTVELQLSRLDDQTAQIIQRLGKGKTLSDKHRMRLAQFVSVMWRQTVKYQEWVKKLGKDFIPQFFEEFVKIREPLTDAQKKEIDRLRELYTGEVPDFLFAKNVVRDSMFELVMYSMDWAFFRPPPGREFLTCDDPARFNTGSGLGHKDAVVIFLCRGSCSCSVSGIRDGVMIFTNSRMRM